MNTIQEGWIGYSKGVIPKDASAVQIEETRRAFYAGAAQVLGVMYEVGSRDLSEPAGVGILEGMHEEVRVFISTL